MCVFVRDIVYLFMSLRRLTFGEMYCTVPEQ